MPKEEADKLVVGDLVANNDIQPTLKTGQPKGHVDVIMRMERFKDVKPMADDYIRGPWHGWAETEKPRRRTIDQTISIGCSGVRLNGLLEAEEGIVDCWVIGQFHRGLPLEESGHKRNGKPVFILLNSR